MKQIDSRIKDWRINKKGELEFLMVRCYDVNLEGEGCIAKGTHITEEWETTGIFKQ